MFATLSRFFQSTPSSRRRAEPKRKRVILELQALEARDCPSTFTWDGPSGGNWSVGANWVGGVAPGPTDDVVFDGAYSTGDCDFTGNGYSQVANSITLKSNYGGTLHFQQHGPASIGAGGVELDSGGIEQDSGQDIECAGNFNWTGGELNSLSTFLANLNLSSGASFNLRLTQNEPTGDNVKLTNGNNGVDDSPGFALDFVKNAGVSIGNGATMNLVDGEFTTSGTGVITNAGTLEKSAGTMTFRTDLPIVNSGVFQLLNGTLNITGTDAKGSFDQSSGSTDLSASTTLLVHQGYYMNGGSLWTEGASQSTSTISGDADIEGGVINLLHGTQTGTGTLSVTGNMKIQGTAEYDAKIDSTNKDANNDLLSDDIAAGTLTLGGQATLKTVSINLVNGKVTRNDDWIILSSANANIAGDFGNFILGFGDGSGGSYVAAKNRKDYDVTS